LKNFIKKIEIKDEDLIVLPVHIVGGLAEFDSNIGSHIFEHV
jgi:hypothetical protein